MSNQDNTYWYKNGRSERVEIIPVEKDHPFPGFYTCKKVEDGKYVYLHRASIIKEKKL